MSWLMMGTTPETEARVLRLSFCLLHRKFGTLKANLAVRAIAEGLVNGPAATAQRKRRLPRQVKLIAVDVHEFNRTLRSFYAVWAIRPDSDLHLCHTFLQPYGFLVSLKKIPWKGPLWLVRSMARTRPLKPYAAIKRADLRLR